MPRETRSTGDPDFPRGTGAQAEERFREGRRITWISVAVNVVLTAMQLVVGFVAHSQSLVADAMHTLSDIVADAFVLVANHKGAEAADSEHPYGHGRFETAASLVPGVVLAVTGAGILLAAAGRLQDLGSAPPVGIAAMWAAVFTMVAKEGLFRYMLASAERLRSPMLVANAWHARSDAASSLVVGLGIAGNLMGYPILDPIAALIVGFLVGKMGWEFGWEAMHDLMDRAADDQEVGAIRETLLQTPGVSGVHDIRTRKMGDMIVVDAHIEVDAQLTVEAGHDIAVEARHRVMQRHRVLNLMTHVDPWRRPDRDHDPRAVTARVG